VEFGGNLTQHTTPHSINCVFLSINSSSRSWTCQLGLRTRHCFTWLCSWETNITLLYMCIFESFYCLVAVIFHYYHSYWSSSYFEYLHPFFFHILKYGLLISNIANVLQIIRETWFNMLSILPNVIISKVYGRKVTF